MLSLSPAGLNVTCSSPPGWEVHGRLHLKDKVQLLMSVSACTSLLLQRLNTLLKGLIIVSEGGDSH